MQWFQCVLEDELDGLQRLLSRATVEINTVDAASRLTALELACTRDKEASTAFLRRAGAEQLYQRFHTGYLFATGLQRCPSITESIGQARANPIRLDDPSHELLLLELVLLFPSIPRKALLRLLSFSGGLTKAARAAVDYYEEDLEGLTDEKKAAGVDADSQTSTENSGPGMTGQALPVSTL